MESNVTVARCQYNPETLHVNSVSKWIFKENQNNTTSRDESVLLLITDQITYITAIKS
jgi:hypothetical protein